MLGVGCPVHESPITQKTYTPSAVHPEFHCWCATSLYIQLTILLISFPAPYEPKRRIKIHPPIKGPPSKNPIEDLTAAAIAILDPSGARQKMFSRHNKDSIRPGDILQVRRRNGDPFSGVLLNIRRRGIDTGFLLRDQLTRVGVEMWFKLYSPAIEDIDLVQRKAKKARRAKLYYMRYVYLLSLLVWCGEFQ